MRRSLSALGRPSGKGRRPRPPAPRASISNYPRGAHDFPIPPASAQRIPATCPPARSAAPRPRIITIHHSSHSANRWPAPLSQGSLSPNSATPPPPRGERCLSPAFSPPFITIHHSSESRPAPARLHPPPPSPTPKPHPLLHAVHNDFASRISFIQFTPPFAIPPNSLHPSATFGA